MKKQLFLSVVLLTVSMEMFAPRHASVPSSSSTPSSRSGSNTPPSRNIPTPSNTPPSDNNTPAPASGSASAAVSQYSGNTVDLIAGAVEAVGQALVGYEAPAGGTQAAKAYARGNSFATTGK